jgi:hypothetical protein
MSCNFPSAVTQTPKPSAASALTTPSPTRTPTLNTACMLITTCLQATMATGSPLGKRMAFLHMQSETNLNLFSEQRLLKALPSSGTMSSARTSEVRTDDSFLLLIYHSLFIQISSRISRRIGCRWHEIKLFPEHIKCSLAMFVFISCLQSYLKSHLNLLRLWQVHVQFFPWLQECTLGGYGRIASNLLKVGKLAMYPGDSKESLPISLLRMYRENNLRLGANTMTQHFQQPSYIIVTNVVCSFLWQLINYMAGIISKHAYFVAS